MTDLGVIVRCDASHVRYLINELFLRSEDVPKGELLVGEFTVKPQGSRVNVKVTDPVATIVFERQGAGDGKLKEPLRVAYV